jgi:hypothetical protein
VPAVAPTVARSVAPSASAPAVVRAPTVAVSVVAVTPARTPAVAVSVVEVARVPTVIVPPAVAVAPEVAPDFEPDQDSDDDSSLSSSSLSSSSSWGTTSTKRKRHAGRHTGRRPVAANKKSKRSSKQFEKDADCESADWVPKERSIQNGNANTHRKYSRLPLNRSLNIFHVDDNISNTLDEMENPNINKNDIIHKVVLAMDFLDDHLLPVNSNEQKTMEKVEKSLWALDKEAFLMPNNNFINIMKDKKRNLSRVVRNHFDPVTGYPLGKIPALFGKNSQHLFRFIAMIFRIYFHLGFKTPEGFIEKIHKLKAEGYISSIHGMNLQRYFSPYELATISFHFPNVFNELFHF